MKQDVLEEFRSAIAAGKSPSDVIAKMKQSGLSIMDAIKAARELYSISLGEAKERVSRHADYAAIAGASAPIHESLVHSFEDSANEGIENP